MSDRMPPNDRRAEQDVLGSILADNAAYSEIVLTVPRPEFFYSFAHQQIFRAMLALIQAGKVADCTTIPDWLRTNRVDLAEIGGIGYLGDLWGTAGAGAGSAEIVKKKFIARQLIHACNELAALAYEPAATADELLEVAEKKIFSISELGIAGRTQTFAEVGQEFLDEMDRRAGRKDGEVFESFVATGFPGLDQMIAGLFKSELTILAARPSQGKTLVGTCIAKNVAKRGHAVLFACMEQRSIEIFSRCVSAEGMIPSDRKSVV